MKLSECPSQLYIIINTLCMYVVFIFTKSFLIGHITFQGTFGNLSLFMENKNSSHLDFCNIDSVSKGYALYSSDSKCFRFSPLPHVFSKSNQGLINNSVILYSLLSFVISCLFLADICKKLGI